jgi:hypothetical protein
MQSKEDGLRTRIALGWTLELVLFAIMLLFSTIESILMDNGFATLRLDPGESIKWLVYIVAFYALMPIYVFSIHELRTRIGRWVAVGLAVVGFVYFLLHHLSHWQIGQRPTFSSHVLDLTFHALGIWVIASSIRWARFPRAA